VQQIPGIISSLRKFKMCINVTRTKPYVEVTECAPDNNLHWLKGWLPPSHTPSGPWLVAPPG